MRKSQLTVFIAMGVVIFILLGMLLYTRHRYIENMSMQATGISEESSKVRSYVNSCILKLGREAISKAREQGGPVYPERYLMFTNENYNTAYYYYHPLKTPPSLSNIQTDIAEYVRNGFMACAVGLSSENAELDKSPPDVSVTIAPRDIIFEVEYPILVRKGTQEQKLQNFYVTIEDSLGQTYLIANRVAEKESQNDFFLHMASSLNGISEPYKLDVKFINSNLLVNHIIDESGVNGKVFVFATKLAG